MVRVTSRDRVAAVLTVVAVASATMGGFTLSPAAGLYTLGIALSAVAVLLGRS